MMVQRKPSPSVQKKKGTSVKSGWPLDLILGLAQSGEGRAPHGREFDASSHFWWNPPVGAPCERLPWFGTSATRAFFVHGKGISRIPLSFASDGFLRSERGRRKADHLFR